MYATSLKHVTVFTLHTKQYKTVLVHDFYPYHREMDQTATKHLPFQQKARPAHLIPTTFHLDTPAPKNSQTHTNITVISDEKRLMTPKVRNLDVYKSII